MINYPQNLSGNKQFLLLLCVSHHFLCHNNMKFKFIGPLHKFPKWGHLHNMEKFDRWKSVLNNATQERGNDYIYNSVRICHQHFEDYFKLPSRRLTRNAIPTLNLSKFLCSILLLRYTLTSKIQKFVFEKNKLFQISTKQN